MMEYLDGLTPFIVAFIFGLVMHLRERSRRSRRNVKICRWFPIHRL